MWASLLVIFVRVEGLVCDLVALYSFKEVIHHPLSMPLWVVRTRHFHLL